jgi:putative ABC transport system permease protein
MSELVQDVRYAGRLLRRAPAFAAIVVLTLGLGIGLNTALFSVVKTVLIEPLPYHDPGRLAMIWSQWPGFAKTWVSTQEYQNYRERLHSFEDMALFQATFEVSVDNGGEPERLAASSVTTNLFSVLGVEPVIGRTFTEQEGLDAGNQVALISHDLWQRRFGGDPAVVGQAIDSNGAPLTIIGVMPVGFRLPLDFATDGPTQIWLPAVLPPFPGTVPPAGGSHGSHIVGRLRAGATPAGANTELASLSRELNEAGIYPPDWNFLAFATTVTDEVAGKIRPALLVLLGAVGLVLLIACANVASLLLVRGEDRKREVSVRAAIGAGRQRLMRQFLVENGLLAVLGGCLGLWLAWLGTKLLVASAPSNLPRLAEIGVDLPVLAFTVGVALLTAVLSGVVPALYASRVDVQLALREGRTATAGRAKQRLRRSMVVGQIALAVVLVVGAGLMLRSFWRLVAIDPGFRAQNVLTLRVGTPSTYYPEAADVQRFYDQVLERVRALPSVEHAGLIRVLPIDNEIGDSCVSVEGYTPPPGQCAPADWQAASDGYFEAMGVRIVEGRAIEARDRVDASQVIVVNEAFVRRYFPDGRALGKQVTFGFVANVAPQVVVGVAADVRHNGLTGEIKPTFFRPHAQWPASTNNPARTMSIVIRSARDADQLILPVRNIIRDVDARLPVSRVQTLEDVLADEVAQPRFTMQLLLLFGGLALLLALLGTYGVISYTVATRRQEMGIRLALGAQRASLVWLSLRQGLVQTGIGLGIGAAVALVATRALSGLLYEVNAVDPLTYGIVVLLAGVAAVIASWLPARRAASADPLSTLRHD